MLYTIIVLIKLINAIQSSYLMYRITDLLLLTLLSLILIPLFAITLLLAKILHKKNIFFVQKRVGREKNVFNLYKFRSMVENAETMGTGLYSFEDDIRITSFGKFLRKTSLDELPQLINVLKGDMSFVGPRPSVVGELDREQGLPANVDDRFSVRPGLTGWAQINGRDSISWAEKARLDLEYISFPRWKRSIINIFIVFYTPLYLLNFRVISESQS
tara:strand:+ start:2480 stop:3127 length:648 start_codon:yes stop_codon:yes gene_type:complete